MLSLCARVEFVHNCLLFAVSLTLQCLLVYSERQTLGKNKGSPSVEGGTVTDERFGMLLSFCILLYSAYNICWLLLECSFDNFADATTEHDDDWGWDEAIDDGTANLLVHLFIAPSSDIFCALFSTLPLAPLPSSRSYSCGTNRRTATYAYACFSC
jgi:hypothetical protein